MSNIRNSNFELLRVIAILMITAYHYVVHGVAEIATMSVGGGILLNVSSLWGKAGVNLFCLIMGYMLVKKENITYNRLKTVEWQILFYTLLGLIVGFILGKHIGLGSLLYSTAPVITGHYWYMTAYVIVFLLCPYINILISKLGKEQFWKLLIILYAVWCIIPFFTLRQSSGMFWSQLIWFIVMYLTGAYIRINPAKFSRKIYVNTLWISNILLILSVLVITWLSSLHDGFTGYITYFRWSNSPLIVAICISMMRLADMATLKTVNWINFLASLVLGIYLFQENIFFQELCWNHWFNNSAPTTLLQLFIHVITSVACVCLIGGIIDFVRIKIFKLLKL